MRFLEEKKPVQSPISTALVVGAAVFPIVWFLRSLSSALDMAAVAAVLTWGTSTLLQSEPNSNFKEKELISLVVGVLAWGVSKFLFGQLLGLIVGGVVGWLLYKRLEEEERKKKRAEEVVSGILGFGAAAGAAALAAWGISKAFDSGGEPSRGDRSDRDGDKMMKAPGRDCYMPRKDFEGNPSAYFRGLRGKE